MRTQDASPDRTKLLIFADIFITKQSSEIFTPENQRFVLPV
jgi:hypothetical protein